MPRFIDQHPTNPNSPPEMAGLIRRRIGGARRDASGSKTISVFVGAATTFCYSEAPGAEAVRQAHAAAGITLAPHDITEVQVLP